MTSRNCSRKHPLYPFTSAFGVGLLLFNAFTFLFIMLTLSTTQASLTSFRMNNPHVLYILMMREPFEILCFLFMAQAVITAVLLFGFMLHKRASVAYLSLPVSRSRLFWSRYAAGLLVLLVPMLIFISWQCYLNLQVFGSSPLVWKAFGWVTAGMAVILFTVYSLTVMICLCVGTVVESILFTGVAIIGVLMLALSVEFIMQTYLLGNTFGEQAGVPNMMSAQLAAYMPPHMPVFGCMTFTEALLRRDITDTPMEISFWGARFDGAVTLVKWAVMSVIFSLLSFKAFLLYKAEQSGSLGVNRWINAIVTFIFVFFTFAVLTAGSYATAPQRLLLGIALSGVVFILCRYLLTFSLQKVLRSLWQYGVMLAIMLAVVVFFVTGMFGYSTWLPETDEVESATITYTGAPDFLRGVGPGTSYETGSYFADNNHANIYLRHFSDLWFTSERDIQTVRMLHETLIDDGLDFTFNRKQQVTDPTRDRLTLYVHVAYQLKNGKTITRLYKHVTAQTALDLLALDDTDSLRARIDNSLHPVTIDSTPLDLESTAVEVSASTSAKSEALDPVNDADDLVAILPSIMVSDPLLTNNIILDPTEMHTLFDALRTDVQHLTRTDKYFSDLPVKAVIAIERPREEINYNVFTYLFSSENGINTVINANGEPFLDMFGPDTNTMRFYITDAYAETLSLLQKMEIIPGSMAGSISDMYVERYAVNPDFFTQALYFRAFSSNDYIPSDAAVRVAQSHYDDLLNRTRSAYYMAEGGYLVRVRIGKPDGGEQWSTFFLPEAAAPDYIS